MEKEKCPVCIKELEETNIFITKCGHTFCGGCILSNINYTNKCPLCRQVIFEDSHDVDDENSSPISTPSDIPNRFDVIFIYTDLIMQHFQDSNSNELTRVQIQHLLNSFERDLRMLDSPSPNNRRVSLSDIDYQQAPNTDGENDYDSIDEIMANLDIPEN